MVSLRRKVSDDHFAEVGDSGMSTQLLRSIPAHRWWLGLPETAIICSYVIKTPNVDKSAKKCHHLIFEGTLDVP